MGLLDNNKINIEGNRAASLVLSDISNYFSNINNIINFNNNTFTVIKAVFDDADNTPIPYLMLYSPVNNNYYSTNEEGICIIPYNPYYIGGSIKDIIDLIPYLGIKLSKVNNIDNTSKNFNVDNIKTNNEFILTFSKSNEIEFYENSLNNFIIPNAKKTSIWICGGGGAGGYGYSFSSNIGGASGGGGAYSSFIQIESNNENIGIPLSLNIGIGGITKFGDYFVYEVMSSSVNNSLLSGGGVTQIINNINNNIILEAKGGGGGVGSTLPYFEGAEGGNKSGGATSWDNLENSENNIVCPLNNKNYCGAGASCIVDKKKPLYYNTSGGGGGTRSNINATSYGAGGAGICSHYRGDLLSELLTRTDLSGKGYPGVMITQVEW